MGRKVKEFVVVLIVAMLFARMSVLAVSPESEGPEDTVSENTESTDTENADDIENDDPEGKEEQQPPELGYEITYPEPNGSSGYYTEIPQVEIRHLEENYVTKYRLYLPVKESEQQTEGEEQNLAEGELAEPGSCAEIREFAQGENILQVWIEDTEGNPADTWQQEFVFLIDTVPPDIKISAPNGWDVWYRNEVLVSARADEHEIGSEIAQMRLYVGGKLEKTVQENVLQMKVSQGSVKGESVAIRAEAYDCAGNQSIVRRELYLDTAAPRVKIEGISDCAISGQSVNLRYLAEEENELQSAQIETVWRSADGELEETYTQDWIEAEEEHAVAMEYEQEGLYQTRIRATDRAGHETCAQLQFLIDKTSPIIHFTEQIDGTYRREFVWNYTAAEAVEDFTTHTYELELDGKMYYPGTVVREEGTHIFSVQATDAAGNHSRGGASFVIDRTAPWIEIRGIEEGGIYKEQAAVQITLNHPEDWITEIRINGVKQELSTRESTANYVFQEPKKYDLVIRAVDRTGNVSERRIAFQIQEPENLVERIRIPVRSFLGLQNSGKSAVDADEKSVASAILKWGCIAVIVAGIAVAGIKFVEFSRRKKKNTD